MGEHGGGSEGQGHLALCLEAGDHPDLDSRVEGLQDGDACEAEGAGAVDEHAAPGRRRMAHDGVERHGEGVGQDCRLVGDAVGHRDQHGVVRGQLLGPGARGRSDDADVDARAEVALGEAPAQAQITGLAGGAGRVDAARTAGQPRVQHDALTDVEAAGLGSEGDDLGHHLVSGHVGERGKGGHRVIDVACVEVAQDELGVGAADAREDRPRHHPVGTDQAGVVDVVQPERDAREHRLQLVLRRGPDLLLVRRCAEEQGLHWSVCWSLKARMPMRKLSMSAVFISMTAFMSGR